MPKENKDLESRLEKSKPGSDISDKFGKVDKSFIAAEVFGEVGAAAGSYLGATLANKYMSGNKFVKVITGGAVGNYAMNSLFAGLYFYFANRDKYKGLSGKGRFLKDQAVIHIRELPAVAASYLIYAPLTALGLVLGASAGVAAVAASIISSILYIGGSYLSNRSYLRNIGGKKKEQHLSQPSPQVSQPAYSMAA